jgi:hypothetical protein
LAQIARNWPKSHFFKLQVMLQFFSDLLAALNLIRVDHFGSLLEQE